LRSKFESMNRFLTVDCNRDLNGGGVCDRKLGCTERWNLQSWLCRLGSIEPSSKDGQVNDSVDRRDFEIE
jgi:hypothetical protein